MMEWMLGFTVIWALCLVLDLYVSMECRSAFHWLFRVVHSVVGGAILAIRATMLFVPWRQNPWWCFFGAWFFFSLCLARFACAFQGKGHPNHRRLRNREILLWSCMATLGSFLLIPVVFALKPDALDLNDVPMFVSAIVFLVTGCLALACKTYVGKLEVRIFADYAIVAVLASLFSLSEGLEVTLFQVTVSACFAWAWIAIVMIRSSQKRSPTLLFWG